MMFVVTVGWLDGGINVRVSVWMYVDLDGAMNFKLHEEEKKKQTIIHTSEWVFTARDNNKN